MELKDFVRALLRPSEWTGISDHDKRRNFFIVNRFCSIAYPEAAQAFNHVRVDAVGALEFWHRCLSGMYKRTPDWWYTKTSKGDKKKKEKDPSVPSDAAIQEYLRRVGRCRRDLDDAVRILGTSSLDPVRRIEEMMKESVEA